ncbi:hypothetical protein MSPP1_003206 [Malassezia sp. CBS 17886]|nr:hypothetical protein MSPP1_003206 [Malassezia sp. CBS 17886]
MLDALAAPNAAPLREHTVQCIAALAGSARATMDDATHAWIRARYAAGAPAPGAQWTTLAAAMVRYGLLDAAVLVRVVLIPFVAGDTQLSRPFWPACEALAGVLLCLPECGPPPCTPAVLGDAAWYDLGFVRRENAQALLAWMLALETGAARTGAADDSAVRRRLRAALYAQAPAIRALWHAHPHAFWTAAVAHSRGAWPTLRACVAAVARSPLSAAPSLADTLSQLPPYLGPWTGVFAAAEVRLALPDALPRAHAQRLVALLCAPPAAQRSVGDELLALDVPPAAAAALVDALLADLATAHAAHAAPNTPCIHALARVARAWHPAPLPGSARAVCAAVAVAAEMLRACDAGADAVGRLLPALSLVLVLTRCALAPSTSRALRAVRADVVRVLDALVALAVRAGGVSAPAPAALVRGLLVDCATQLQSALPPDLLAEWLREADVRHPHARAARDTARVVLFDAPRVPWVLAADETDALFSHGDAAPVHPWAWVDSTAPACAASSDPWDAPIMNHAPLSLSHFRTRKLRDPVPGTRVLPAWLPSEMSYGDGDGAVVNGGVRGMRWFPRR